MHKLVLIAHAHADGVFIGPYDLSLSLGVPTPNPDPHPTTEEAIQRILSVAHKAGKKWFVDFTCCFMDYVDSLAYYYDRGGKYP